MRRRRFVRLIALLVLMMNGAFSRAVDRTLQAASKVAMLGKSGTVVVLNAHSGHVLAIYRSDVAARRVVAPGSTIKPFTLMALLQSGKVNAHTALMCKRHTNIDGHKLDCTHPVIAQPLTPATALAYSCNSYFTTVAVRLTPAQLQRALLRTGFGSSSGSAADVTGSVQLAESPEQLQLQAIGEWGVQVTPSQMAGAYRKLALLEPKHNPTLDPLFAGLEDSVAYGMADAAQPPGYMKVAGKTGTAPAAEGQWTHAWFAGYAPSHNPDIVLVVFLERGHGGSDAAGVARAIFSAFANSQRLQHAGSQTGEAR